MRGFLRTSIRIIFFLLTTQLASAQEEYPDRPLRLIVPFPPGALTDAISRVFAEEAGKRLGKPVVVENRGGASTALGSQAAKQAPADGYTLLFGSSVMISTMLSLKNPGYAMSDFTPVTMLGDHFYILMTSKSLPVKDLKEFVAYAKENSGSMNYGVLGAGTPSYSPAQKLGKAVGIEWQDIAYRGAAQVFQAVVSNDVQGYFTTQASAINYVNSGKVKLLAVAAEERVAPFLDVPTFKELGYEGLVEHGWSALFVRSETPKAIVDKLRQVSAEVMKSEAMQNYLKTANVVPHKGAVEDFSALLEKEMKAKREEAAQLGIEPQ